MNKKRKIEDTFDEKKNNIYDNETKDKKHNICKKDEDDVEDKNNIEVKKKENRNKASNYIKIIGQLYERNVILGDILSILNNFYYLARDRWERHNEEQELDIFFDDMRRIIFEYLEPIMDYIGDKDDLLKDIEIPHDIKHEVYELVGNNRVKNTIPDPVEYMKRYDYGEQTEEN